MVVARQLVERSRFLRLVRQVERDPERRLTRCAWCRRYAVNDDWLELGQMPRHLRERIKRSLTHGICPCCLADQRERRQTSNRLR